MRLRIYIREVNKRRRDYERWDGSRWIGSGRNRFDVSQSRAAPSFLPHRFSRRRRTRVARERRSFPKYRADSYTMRVPVTIYIYTRTYILYYIYYYILYHIYYYILYYID